MRRQFGYHLTRVENIIARMLQRGDAFFEETIRLGRVFDLLNKDKIRGEFERQVVAGTETADRRSRRRVDRLDGRAGPARSGRASPTTSTGGA